MLEYLQTNLSENLLLIIGIILIFAIFENKKATLLLITFFLIKLIYTNQINYLIHPRNFYLIYISIALFIVTIVINKSKNTNKNFTLYLLNFIFICGILIDIKPLSAHAKTQAFDENNIFNLQVSKKNQIHQTFNINTEDLSLEDLVKIFSQNPEPQEYIGKKVELEGFYYLSNNNPMIAKYIISCCAADARPIGIWLENTLEFEENTWLKISGTLSEKTENNQRSIVISPDKIETIKIPLNPYANL